MTCIVPTGLLEIEDLIDILRSGAVHYYSNKKRSAIRIFLSAEAVHVLTAGDD